MEKHIQETINRCNPLMFLRRKIDTVTSKLDKGCRIEDAIMISGVPRGGTTWFMEILSSLSNYRLIFEPFNKNWFPEIKQINLSPRPYLNPSSTREESIDIYSYLEKVFRGKIASRNPNVLSLTPQSIYKHLSATKILVKFVRCNRLLPWITINFRLRGIFFMIRHPCATIASQLETGIRGYFLPRNTPIPKKIILEDISKLPKLRENERLLRQLSTIETQEEILAAIWSIDNYIPLSYLSEHQNAWYTVVYEKLIRDFKEEIQRIFKNLEEEIPREVYGKYGKPSKTTHDDSYLGTSKQLLKWKAKLSKRQVERILKVTRWFGLDFYTDEPEPDYELLKNWKPPF